MMCSMPIFFLLCLALLASGCGDKKSATSVSGISEITKVETVFMKGDPNQLVENTQSNAVSFINTSNLLLLNDFSLSHVIQFTEKEEIVQKADTESEGESSEAGNEATDVDETEQAKSKLYSFFKSGNEYIYESPSTELKFVFKETEGELNLISLRTKIDNFHIRPLHYSMKKSGDAFSVLAQYSDGNSGRILIAFTFTRKSVAQKIPVTALEYKYIWGAGVKVPWEQKQKLEVNICGKQSQEVERAYVQGVLQWAPSLDKRMSIAVKTLSAYPPFSDLNTHCIYTVKNYQTIYGNKFVNAASTIVKGNLFKGSIIDADIMIWVKEHEKVGVTFEQAKKLQLVTAHETGHLLGLHHQFDKTIKSIMGYEGHPEISEYDVEAIKRLYPKL